MSLLGRDKCNHGAVKKMLKTDQTSVKRMPVMIDPQHRVSHAPTEPQRYSFVKNSYITVLVLKTKPEDVMHMNCANEQLEKHTTITGFFKGFVYK